MNKYILLVLVILAGCDGGAPVSSLAERPPQATCSAIVTWEPPAERTDGSELTKEELQKFTIYINRRDDVDENNLISIIDITDTDIVTWEVSDLTPGKKYFYMTVTDTDGRTSTFSNILSKLC